MRDAPKDAVVLLGTVACGFCCSLVLFMYNGEFGLVSHASLVIDVHRFPNVTI